LDLKIRNGRPLMKNESLNWLKPNAFFKAASALLLVIAVATALMAACGGTITEVLSSPEKIKSFVEARGVYGFLVFIAFQIIQIVVAIIPGEPIQIAGGYIFGTLGGFSLSTIGIMIGSVISFLISRKFGVPLVRNFVSEDKLLVYKSKFESRKGLAIIFLLCLIPGIPKDVLVYAAGLTPIRFGVFFFLYFFARIPAMVMASYMGAQLGQNNLSGFLIIGVIAALVLVVGYVLKDRVYEMLNA
jgi:uncharacterized membrane protein YdjX (TVP38/TMEM64 family)